MNNTHCPRCGTSNPSTMRFCLRCGWELLEKGDLDAPARPKVAATLACDTCGRSNPSSMQFCLQCGAVLVGVPAAPAPAPALPEPVRASAARPRRGIRRVALATAVAVVAAAAGVGGWWLGRDDGPPGAAAGADVEATIAALVGEPSTAPPSLSPSGLLGVFEDSGVLSDPAVFLDEGVTIEQEDGATYRYDGSTWSAITPGGGVWVLPDQEAVVVERDGVIEIQGSTGGVETGWVEQVLDATPGLSRDGEIYVVEDYVAYRDGFIQAAAEQGVWVDEPIRGSVVMTRPVSFEPVWVEQGEGHIWIADRTAAVLVVETTEEPVVAGRLVSDDTISGSVWEPAPGAEAVSGHVEQVFGGIEGATVENGQRRVPFKIYVLPDQETLDKMERKRIAYENRDPNFEPTNIVLTRGKGRECSMFGCFLDGIGGGLVDAGRGTAGFTRKWGGKALDEITLERLDCVMKVAGHVVCAYETAETTYEIVLTTADIVELLWKERGNLFAEKNCETPGPHPPSDPAGATRDYPSRDYEARLAAWSDQHEADWADRLEFARAWMPLIEFSNDEQCGEILRIFAEVHGYTPDGGAADTLGKAAWVEITYTVFLKYDGGRFAVLGKDHPGDNEGFVIGLVRTDRRDGLCRTGFEFAAGRTVAHSNVGGWLAVDYLAANSRQIDDFTVADVGTPCPDPPRTGSAGWAQSDLEVGGSHPWRILMAEGKHATYYHRDPGQSSTDPDRTNCEAALVPDLPLMVTAIAGGGGVFGALTVPALRKLAEAVGGERAEDILSDLENGLEECEAGRPLMDLSPLLELYGDVAAGNPDDLGFNVFSDVYATEGGVKTFMEQARGRWCFARPRFDNVARFEGTVCPKGEYEQVDSVVQATREDSYDFHVQSLFQFEPTPLPPAMVQLPDMTGWTEDRARDEVEGMELVFRPVREVVPDPARDGLVIRHVPAGSSVVQEGSVVEVVIGAYETQSIPPLEGRDARDARADLMIYGFVYDPVFESVDDPGLDNVVLRSDPPEGTPAPAGTVVTVWVGRYQEPEAVVVTAPYLGRKTLLAARSEIEGLGLVYVYGGKVATDDPAFDGVVAGQTPDPGTALVEGDTVTVFEGDYTPPQVTVPDVLGLPADDAVEVIEDFGLVPLVAGTLEANDSYDVGRVMQQDPYGGTAASGSTVQIWVGVAAGHETGIPTTGGSLDPSAAPDHRLTLSSGFTPDPNLTQDVSYAGSLAIDVSYLGGGCAGYARAEPMFGVSWSGGGSLLRFFFIPPDGADTTMVVRAPDGQWYCNDDSFSTRHPSVAFTGPATGTYLVWIGAFSGGGAGGWGDLYVTEVDGYHP